MMRGLSVINLSLASKLGPNCGRQVKGITPFDLSIFVRGNSIVK